MESKGGKTPIFSNAQRALLPTGGMFARRAPGARPACYLSINYPDFSPGYTLRWRRPPQ